jgi:hypothetical protein
MMMADVIAGPRQAWVREWAARQVYIALGNFMTSAALVGVDTCPLEGIDPREYDAILDLPSKGFNTIVACAAGYRSAEDKYATLPKVRFEKANSFGICNTNSRKLTTKDTESTEEGKFEPAYLETSRVTRLRLKLN